MLKFLKTRTHHHDSEARQKLQRELFDYQQTVNHGFPHHPSALAYDSKLNLLAIGTRTGHVRIYGAPGVEFYGAHEEGEHVGVRKLYFLPNQGRLISQLENNSLHLWEWNLKDGKSMLEIVKSFQSDEGKKISTCCLCSDAQSLLMGMENGNVHMLDIQSFELTDQVISQELVMQNAPDDYKVTHPGAVEAIVQHPSDPDKFLIGYARGLMVVWNNSLLSANETYVCNQSLESLTWARDGSKFLSAHNDGSYITWSLTESAKDDAGSTTPYGPFPCKPITKIDYKTSSSEPFLIFAGGMPRASYGDRNTVTVMTGDQHQVFDFTSKLVDYVVLCNNVEEVDDPHTLVLLLEEEITFVDLQTADWPAFQLPYLTSLHASAITCATHASDVPDEMWDKLVAAGAQQASQFSARDWPITGGKNLTEPSSKKDLLMTGHEDGSVRFWDASTVSLRLLYKLRTSAFFVGEHDHSEHEEEEWPPFRKVGCFDPYSDDPRLGIQKISICVSTGTLALAGTAGQVIIMNMTTEETEREVHEIYVQIVNDRDNFVWKGHEALTPKDEAIKIPAGFQPITVLQMTPPAACTALALNSEWGLVTSGTAHGFALFDYVQKKPVMSRCTLNPTNMTGTSESGMARRKSLKKSLRESFRRLRKIRHKKDDEKKGDTSADAPKKAKKEKKEKKGKKGKEEKAAEEKPPEEVEEGKEKLEETKVEAQQKEEEKHDETIEDTKEKPGDDDAPLKIEDAGEIIAQEEGFLKIEEHEEAPVEIILETTPEEKLEEEHLRIEEPQDELKIVEEAIEATEEIIAEKIEEKTDEIVQPEVDKPAPTEEEKGGGDEEKVAEHTDVIEDKPVDDVVEEQVVEESKAAEAEATPKSPELDEKGDVVRSVERVIEERQVDDSMASMVRSLYLTRTYLISGHQHNATLWAGTNTGTIYAYTLTVPDGEKRTEEAVTAQLGKEVQLKHRAPVLALCVIDSHGYPLPDTIDVQKQRMAPPNMDAGQKVVIASMEQFKVFHLPSLKPYCKFKLTAHEGALVRKTGFLNYRSSKNEEYSEWCLTCLSNLGELSIYTVPQLRRQLLKPCIRKEDINGISSAVFSQRGEGFYQNSSSEITRFSLSASTRTAPHCVLELPEGMRPAPPPEPEPKPAKEEQQPEAGEKQPKEITVKEEKNVEAEKKDKPQDVSTAADTTGDITQDSITDHTTQVKTDTVTEGKVAETDTASIEAKITEGMDEEKEEGDEAITRDLYREVMTAVEGRDAHAKPEGEEDMSGHGVPSKDLLLQSGAPFPEEIALKEAHIPDEADVEEHEETSQEVAEDGTITTTRVITTKTTTKTQLEDDVTEITTETKIVTIETQQTPDGQVISQNEKTNVQTHQRTTKLERVCVMNFTPVEDETAEEKQVNGEVEESLVTPETCTGAQSAPAVQPAHVVQPAHEQNNETAHPVKKTPERDIIIAVKTKTVERHPSGERTVEVRTETTKIVDDESTAAE